MTLVPPPRASRLTDSGSAAPNSADRQRWGTASAARTVPRIDWTELLGVSCNRLLDGGPDEDHTEEDDRAEQQRAEGGEKVDARLRGEEDAGHVEKAGQECEQAKRAKEAGEAG